MDQHADDDAGTAERRLLDAVAGVRDAVAAMPDFVVWRDRLPEVVVDGERFRVVGGDRLMDDEQVVVEWVRRFRPDVLAAAEGRATDGDQGQDQDHAHGTR